MSEALQLAKHYFELSNEGNLAEIKNLFTPSSTYSSQNTGMYLGADQIMKMQSEFFASFETMNWEIRNATEVKPGVVLFDFAFTGRKLGGELVSSYGLEHVIIYRGKLQHIEVRFTD